jgi:malate dehydrogenase (oxaloacetate-decarboxylating)
MSFVTTPSHLGQFAGREDAMVDDKGLAYRRKYRGLIGVDLKVPVKDRHVLSVVYTPGVAEPCMEIFRDPDSSFDYTCRANTVALVTDASRVLGRGDLGPLPALPLMEGRSVIFKSFAGVDAFPICLDTQDPEEIVQAVAMMAPTFGAVCLEDITSPRCFAIEGQLRRALNVPVFHNDQHAGAILALACLINALRITGKRKEGLRVVINGAGAAGIATSRFLLEWGISDLLVCDRHGALYIFRPVGMNWAKSAVAWRTNPRGIRGGLAEALDGADVFIGFSAGGALSAEMVSRMARDPIVLAFANPVPEISLQEAREGGARIVALSSSTVPNFNELNIATVFPGVFRGALDVGAREINYAMRLAAAQTLADSVPTGDLNEEYMVPRIMDFRTAPAVAAAVARTAMETGTARKTVDPQKVAEETERFVYEGHFTVPPKSEERMTFEEESLELHRRYRGVVGVKAKIPVKDHHILRLLYLPRGEAEASRLIAENPLNAYDITCKSNLVAVITDGSAVLGLGNIGARAALPVMEGKCALFQTFGGVEAYPICVATQEPEEFIRVVQVIAPSFGGINLEDIAAPRCFAIEQELSQTLDIPVFHDDQHGTAVVVLAALINALKVVGKEISEAKVMVSGAGAAAIAVTRMLVIAGIRDIVLCDRQGAIHIDREEGMNPIKRELAGVTNPHRVRGAIPEVLEGRDVFLGLSVPGLITTEMVRSMAKDAIIFAMANPTPEIMPDAAIRGGAKVVATGRSDFPNQVNNCLGFPGIFRGALDVMARTINEAMKLAAAKALAEAVPDSDLRSDFIIPDSMDLHVPPKVAAAVARAAMETGVFRREVDPDLILRRTHQYLLEGGVLTE